MKTTTRPTPAVLIGAAAGLLALAAAATVPASARAADAAAPANPQQFVYRVTGLFAPDREADLREALKAMPGVELVALDFDHAEATFRYDPAVTLPGTAPDKAVEKFDEVLRNASGQLFGVKPVSTAPRDKLTRVEIAVESIDCKACCLGLYDMLAPQDGVEQVGVYLKDGRVSVLIDPAKTSREALETLLKSREVTLKEPAAN